MPVNIPATLPRFNRDHYLTQFPRQNIPGIIIQHGRETIQAPVHDLESDEIRLPEPVYSPSRMDNFIPDREHDIGGTCDQVLRLEKTIITGFLDVVLPHVRDIPGELPWRFVRILQLALYHMVLLRAGDLVPELPRIGPAVTQPIVTCFNIEVLPRIKGTAENPEFS